MKPKKTARKAKKTEARLAAHDGQEIRRISPGTGDFGAPAMEQGEERKTIAVLDDEPTMLELLGGELASQGYEVVACADKANFLRKMPQLKVDLVITDLNSPGMNGFQFIEELRKKKKWSRIPVLIASGVGGEAVAEAKDRGVFEVFQKPYGVEELLAAIRRALHEKAGSSPGRYPGPRTDR